MALYVFFNEELVQASISKDKGKLQSVWNLMNDLAQSWKTIANSTANAPAAQVENALNIIGLKRREFMENLSNEELEERVAILKRF